MSGVSLFEGCSYLRSVFIFGCPYRSVPLLHRMLKVAHSIVKN